MTKKTKSKSRLDKFYHLAKEQGYRSRAAFKLIQLNKKYNFLESARVVVDLCAAPGGWMQVASKNAQQGCLIVGVDLDQIKPVPGCISIQQDITTKECLESIRTYTKHMKADIVLNDGAPNVGADWSKDAYGQIELVLLSLKLVTQLLKKGGWFVTKVFRCSDYQSLFWVLSKFFRVVEANKPLASRDVSAEIFLVCQDYLAPDKIDPKFFDPTFVFGENEEELRGQQEAKQVQSVSKLFEKKRREIIAEGTPLTMHRTGDFEEFIQTTNPYIFLQKNNQIKIEKNQFWLEIQEKVKVPEDLEDMVKDVKQMSKGDVAKLLKFRGIVREKLNITSKENVQERKPIQGAEVQEVDEAHEFLQKQKKQDKKEKVKLDKQILKFVKKKVMTDNSAQQIDNEFDNLKVFDFEKFGENFEEDLVVEDQEPKKDFKTKTDYYKEISENIEYLYDQRREKDTVKEQEQIEKKQKIKKHDLKNPQLIKQDFKDQQINMESLKNQSKWFSQDTFNILKNKEAVDQVIVQPEEDSADQSASEDQEKIQRQLQKSYKKPKKNFDDDEIAEIVAIGKKMLRKKDREEIVDQAYNRWNYQDDNEDLPHWFVEDEQKHVGKIDIVTKEDAIREKEYLLTIKNRMPKKVMEAKMWQKKRFVNKLKKAQTQVAGLLDQEGLDPRTKARQINELYKKAVKAKRGKGKKMIIGTKTSVAAPNRTSGRKFKMVDKRLKKDQRAMARVNKKKKINKRSHVRK